ncbi:uncharacterized protein LY89DRAFT_722478 [Mollisia scopiformis]|uniref:Uncharacterized protein n=1 Tax=Mollisia scopiformis TaxID=149040 RepID=A0A194WVV8_MOLSC|nr:uncharacterized protein LY89DRAFT_722478 [Mollisia scopiformis]KUJ12103.1 hypothetical protein LY89DRAFT_722478 [Mollisia scopiformis]
MSRAGAGIEDERIKTRDRRLLCNWKLVVVGKRAPSFPACCSTKFPSFKLSKWLLLLLPPRTSPFPLLAAVASVQQLQPTNLVDGQSDPNILEYFANDEIVHEKAFGKKARMSMDDSDYASRRSSGSVMDDMKHALEAEGLSSQKALLTSAVQRQTRTAKKRSLEEYVDSSHTTRSSKAARFVAPPAPSRGRVGVYLSKETVADLAAAAFNANAADDMDEDIDVPASQADNVQLDEAHFSDSDAVDSDTPLVAHYEAKRDARRAAKGKQPAKGQEEDDTPTIGQPWVEDDEDEDTEEADPVEMPVKGPADNPRNESPEAIKKEIDFLKSLEDRPNPSFKPSRDAPAYKRRFAARMRHVLGYIVDGVRDGTYHIKGMSMSIKFKKWLAIADVQKLLDFIVTGIDDQRQRIFGAEEFNMQDILVLHEIDDAEMKNLVGVYADILTSIDDAKALYIGSSCRQNKGIWARIQEQCNFLAAGDDINSKYDTFHYQYARENELGPNFRLLAFWPQDIRLRSVTFLVESILIILASNMDKNHRSYNILTRFPDTVPDDVNQDVTWKGLNNSLPLFSEWIPQAYRGQCGCCRESPDKKFLKAPPAFKRRPRVHGTTGKVCVSYYARIRKHAIRINDGEKLTHAVGERPRAQGARFPPGTPCAYPWCNHIKIKGSKKVVFSRVDGLIFCGGCRSVYLNRKRKGTDLFAPLQKVIKQFTLGEKCNFAGCETVYSGAQGTRSFQRYEGISYCIKHFKKLYHDDAASRRQRDNIISDQ